VRDHDVSRLTASELERARRELAAGLALSRPDSPIRAPILSHMSAIDRELAERSTSATLRLCSCGFATDDGPWFDGHLFDYPGHSERNLERYVAATAEQEAKL
jgi:hypothetical protein